MTTCCPGPLRSPTTTTTTSPTRRTLRTTSRHPRAPTTTAPPWCRPARAMTASTPMNAARSSCSRDPYPPLPWPSRFASICTPRIKKATEIT
ncbi:adipocyte plasma membrane-associated protein Hemomucin-like [Lethenteron reissneri]|uniref:adipocyte plasma membrane-associated protein Hemomucin-like n=1 Tax=Lethenteron reissneri TaxID=7753 RepID=UPI002AB7C07D|nr:adipocyte plasma membrane-associated protein Hemomucin-like [Lethenteron reissneri]